VRKGARREGRKEGGKEGGKEGEGKREMEKRRKDIIRVRGLIRDAQDEDN
jgi:hypothetical protein